MDRVGQVVLIQLYVADGSSWPSPGFGQSGGADTLRTSCTMIRSGSQIGNGYSGTFLLNPTTVGLKPSHPRAECRVNPQGAPSPCPLAWCRSRRVPAIRPKDR